MPLYRVVVLACVLVCMALSCAAEVIVVESRPEGQNFANYQEILGRWISSQTPPQTAKSQAAGLTDCNVCGSRKVLFYHQNIKGTTAPAAARFLPRVSSPGHYHVYATWPKAANATPVYYSIFHAKGVTTKTLTQNGVGAKGPSNANIWTHLGSYDFRPGDDQFVELRIELDAEPIDRVSFGQVYSDAVMFSTEPGGAPTATPAAASTPVTYVASTPVATPPPTPKVVPEPVWFSDIPQAMTAASQSRRRILLFFHSPQSLTCQYYEREVFSNPEFKILLSNSYIPVRVDFVSQPDVAAKLGVFKAGVMCIYDSQGQPVGQVDERLTAPELVARLR